MVQVKSISRLQKKKRLPLFWKALSITRFCPQAKRDHPERESGSGFLCFLLFLLLRMVFMLVLTNPVQVVRE
jgi:hypothetical protein